MAGGNVLHDKCNAIVFWLDHTAETHYFYCPSCRTEVKDEECHIEPEAAFAPEPPRLPTPEGRDTRFIQ